MTVQKKYSIIVAFLILLISSMFIIGKFGTSWFSVSNITHYSSQKHIQIVYPNPIESLSPFSTAVLTQYTIPNIYEGLITFDQNLSPQPGLAYAYGMIDPTQWEFIIRDPSYFSNGVQVTAQDVITSFHLYRQYAVDASLLDNIDEIQEINDHTIHIVTKYPDVLFLSKVARVPIIRHNTEPDTLSAQPLGTGPYKLQEWQDGKRMIFIRNDFYWGGVSTIESVEILFESDHAILSTLLQQKSVDIVLSDTAFLPDNEEYILRTEPTLSTRSLLYNFQSPFFQSKEIRKKIGDIIRQQQEDYIQQQSGSPIVMASQFVCNGVTGYNAILETDTIEHDIASFPPQTLSLAFSESDRPLAEWLRDLLQRYNITISLTSFSSIEQIDDGYDLYLFPWQFTYGDAGDFFSQVVHTRGTKSGYGLYNWTHIGDETLDTLIETSDKSFNPLQRLKNLKDINYIITKKDIIGVPLFEIRSSYIVARHMVWNPRLDGRILFSEMDSI